LSASSHRLTSTENFSLIPRIPAYIPSHCEVSLDDFTFIYAGYAVHMLANGGTPLEPLEFAGRYGIDVNQGGLLYAP
jgi:hypothetical protein